MSDIFQEVDEEVRREKLQQLWERHSNLIVALALLVVLAVGGWRGYEWWEGKKAAESGTAFEAAISLAEAGKQAEAQAAFAKIAQDGSSGYRILARFREAAELAKTDPAAAVNAYGALAADSSLGRTLQDLAAVRGGLILVDTAPLAELTAKTRAADRRGPPVPPHRARVARASAWRNGRQRRRETLVRPDHNRCRDARRHARAPGGADDAVRRKSEDVTGPAMHRLLTAAALVSASRLRGAAIPSIRSTSCQDLDIMGTSKKPLSGERRAVFPEGVPGVAQGVPPELVKGYQPPAETPPPVVEAKPEKPKPKPKKVAVPRKPRPQPQQAAAAADAAGAGANSTTTQPAGPQSAGAIADHARARSRPGRPTRRRRPDPGPARSANVAQARLYRPRIARLIELISP